jgi:tetratricopeptide (TPR) repeat protein
MAITRVPMFMTRFGTVAICLALAAACGGKKAASTTPTGGGAGTGGSMTDLDPDGGPDGGGPDGARPGTPGGNGGSDPGGGPGEPAVIAPNLDADPSQVKAQVDQQLAAAKAALAQNPPDADGAIRAARAALALDATSVDGAAYIAFGYYHKRLYDTAELVLDDLFKREAAKKNANVYYVYGLVYDKTDRPERAFKAYTQAVQYDPRHASAWVNLGAHQLKNSQYNEAQATFERLTKEFGRNDAITLTSLGSAYRGRSADYPNGATERAQFVRSAEAAYKRALQVNSSYGPAYYNLGLLYLDTDPFPGVADTMQRLNAAKAYFDQYKNMPGFDMKLYDSRLKDVDKAIKREQKKQKQKKPA